MEEQVEKKLLEQVNEEVIKKRSDDDKTKKFHGETFNVFSLCGVDHYELWHSKILAEFLNPGGSHGQGTRFLQFFAERFLSKSGCQFAGSTSVSTEVTSYIKDLRIGRFDILVEDAVNKSVCIIENKIFAGEQEEQLNRYYEWLKTNRNEWKRCLVFLTLDGHKSVTIADEKQYLPIAYASNTHHPSLVDWIEKCANSVKEIPRLCYTFIQYKDHILKLANGDKAMSEQVLETLKNNMAAAQAIYENYKAACVSKANEILKKSVLDKLNENNSGWRAEGTCDFNHKEAGILFIPPGGNPGESQGFCGHIFVVFGETNLCQCQVALWQDVKNDKNAKLLLTDEHNKIIPDDVKWHVTRNSLSAWPLWRGISASQNDENHLGIDWNGVFFDRMSRDNSVKECVINDIVASIKELYEFQKNYSNIDKKDHANID